MRRVILDQNLPRRAAVLLRESGWEAVHVGEIGMTQASDKEILAVARRNGQVCVTRDADFHSMLAVEHAGAPSVVRIRLEELTSDQTAAVIRRVWMRFEADLDAGAVVTVTRNKMRCRRLPVGR